MIVRRTDGGVEILTPAKLNLFLEIVGKRPDGYHDLVSLMVATDLRDRLTVEPTDAPGISFACDDPSLPLDSSNLVVKAANLLRGRLGETRGASIRLYKSIPAQGGLGGGSSDAAATLVGLDRIWGTNLPAETLRGLAGELGSDCAFFLGGAASVCRGRGEIVEPIPAEHKYSFVLVNPGFGVSTAAVYRELVPPESPRSVDAAARAFASGDVKALGRELFNRLQPVAERSAPALHRVRDALQSLVPSHLDGILLSGSGSTYFGLAPTPDAAIAAAARLAPLGLGRVLAASSES